MIRITVPVEPRPQPRPRFGNGRAYEPAQIKSYKAKIKSAALAVMDGANPLSCEIACRLKFFRKFKSTSRRFGDCDNLYKSTVDALNGTVFVDDAQIISAHIEKISVNDAASERVEIEVEELSRDD